MPIYVDIRVADRGCQYGIGIGSGLQFGWVSSQRGWDSWRGKVREDFIKALGAASLKVQYEPTAGARRQPFARRMAQFEIAQSKRAMNAPWPGEQFELFAPGGKQVDLYGQSRQNPKPALSRQVGVADAELLSMVPGSFKKPAANRFGAGALGKVHIIGMDSKCFAPAARTARRRLDRSGCARIVQWAKA